MKIKEGDKLPDAKVLIIDMDKEYEHKEISTSEILNKDKIILFGLPGAFVYRAINTIDSMVGYKTSLFRNIGWFGANCDTILNYIPSRLTGLVMILSALILGYNWKESFYIMRRDGKKLESPNAGFPIAALAGALGTKLEKINYYAVGDGNIEFTKSHIISAIRLMKVSSILFCGLITVPIISALSFLGWWLHA